MTTRLYYMSVITLSGTTIYEQQLGSSSIDQDLIDSISSIALGFKNTIDVNLSSINYLDFTIYFRRGENFLAVLLASSTQEAEHLINQMFEDLMRENIIADFIQFAKLDLKCNNPDIMKSIQKIMYNLDFVASLTNFKKEIKDNTQRF